MSTSPRRTAVSYSRFSCELQAGGDSEDRQDRAYRAFCERHNLTPGKEVFADRGRSGYSGAHRTRGRLGQLIDAAKDGRFEPGTVVVIEAWDRLGRLRPDKQTELVAELLRTGVSIGVCRLDDIFTEDDFGSHKWTTLAVFIQLAHQESKQKSERVGASWEMRRKRARETGALVGSRIPAWIEVEDGKPRLIPERAAALRRIYQLAAEGMGHTRIVGTLTKEGVPPFGEKVVNEGRKRSQFAGGWTKPYVALLLRDRRVVGEYQPLKNDKPDGPPIAGYYPAAVTEEEYALARAGQEQRLGKDKLGRAKMPRQARYVNVFKSMLVHARDGDGFLLHNKGTAAKPELLLLNHKGNGGSGPCYTFPYPAFEEKVLTYLKEIDPADVLPEKPTARSVADVIRAKLANCREDIGNLKRDLKASYSKGLAEVLREKEAVEEDLVNDLQDELARTARPLERAWKELPTLIDMIRDAEDPDAARLRVRVALRAVLESGTVLIVPKGAWRFLALQMNFMDGVSRHYVIVYRPAANQRPVIVEALTFAEVGLPGDVDLRQADHVQRVEKFFASTAVAKVTASLADKNRKSK